MFDITQHNSKTYGDLDHIFRIDRLWAMDKSIRCWTLPLMGRPPAADKVLTPVPHSVWL